MWIEHILYVHSLIDISVFFFLWLFWIMLLRTFIYKFCHFAVLSHGYVPKNRVIGSCSDCLTFCRTPRIFSKAVTLFYILSSNILQVLVSPHLLVLMIFPLKTNMPVGSVIQLFCLHFPNDKWYYASSHMLIWHLFVFCGKHLFSSLTIFLCLKNLDCSIPYYIFMYKSLLYDLLTFFSHSMGFFTVLMVYFKAQKCLTLIASDLFFMLFVLWLAKKTLFNPRPPRFDPVFLQKMFQF